MRDRAFKQFYLEWQGFLTTGVLGDDTALGRPWLLFCVKFDWKFRYGPLESFLIKLSIFRMSKFLWKSISVVFCYFSVMQKFFQTFLTLYICKSEVQIRIFSEKEITAAGLVTAEQSCHRTLFFHHGLTVAFTASLSFQCA